MQTGVQKSQQQSPGGHGAQGTGSCRGGLAQLSRDAPRGQVVRRMAEISDRKTVFHQHKLYFSRWLP